MVKLLLFPRMGGESLHAIKNFLTDSQGQAPSSNWGLLYSKG